MCQLFQLRCSSYFSPQRDQINLTKPIKCKHGLVQSVMGKPGGIGGNIARTRGRMAGMRARGPEICLLGAVEEDSNLRVYVLHAA